jgi:6-methylpretetramide 4-monooxygenase / 4-hydroxy-6-methylpretetramide 12a-monooxygenase
VLSKPAGCNEDVGGSTGADVLVVGAGPSGLFAAIELARHGVKAHVVERARQPHRQARATALQPATLEILKSSGLLDHVLAASVHVRFARVFDAGLACTSEVRFAGVGCEWEFQCSLPQWRTEEILAGRLAELGGGVDRGVTVTSVTERGDGVLVGLEEADGTRRTAEAAWVIGAGGAHSTTRGSMAETLAGSTYPGTGLAADVQVSCSLPRDGSALIGCPAGYMFLAPLPGGRWLTFVGDLADSEVAALQAGPSDGPVAAVVGRRLPADLIRVDDVAWAGIFRMQRRMVSRLADPRRFLLGDAGHLSSPFGGEGLNSGLHDASNLAWKLALQIRGRARPGLVESFASERLAADQHVLQVSDRVHELAAQAVESARSGTRPDPPPPAAAAALLRARCMLDVSYPDSPLTGGHAAAGPPLPSPAPGDRYPDRASLTGTAHTLLLYGAAQQADVSRLRQRWRGLLDIRPGAGGSRQAGLVADGAILVRPDGYIGFRAAPADQAGLAALDAHLDSYLVPAGG